MNLASDPGPEPPRTPAAVAEMLGVIALADQQVADAVGNISDSRWRVSSSTVLTLEHLLTTLRPAACERERLALVDRETLRAGIRLWATGGLGSAAPGSRESRT